MTIIFMFLVVSFPWSIKQVARLCNGNTGMEFVCGDADHDGKEEIIFSGRTDEYVPCYQIWENAGWNRYRLVHSDTGCNKRWPPGPGIFTGNFWPSDIGDPDRDGMTDVLGYNVEFRGDSIPYRRYALLVLMESPAEDSYPTRMVWYRYLEDSLGTYECDWRMLMGDLDHNGREEIIYTIPGWGCMRLLEACGNNQYEPVWLSNVASPYDGAVGDFDLDGMPDFVTSNALVWVNVFENRGPGRYDSVWTGMTNSYNCGDAFSGRDVNQNGRPEFFVRSAQYHGIDWHFDLFMWEATGDNQYERFHIADAWEHDIGGPYGFDSECDDIDGDGVEEVVWSLAGSVRVLKPITQYEFQTVAYWFNDLPWHYQTAVRVHDMNHNGYGDIVVSADYETAVLEVEAIRVISPNGWRILQPGDTCWIRWQVFNPPRCDSVSLLLRVGDYQMDTIATGLAPSDTPYAWVIPESIRAVPCWVMAIAYGPGWQYDEQDTAMWIVGIGESGERPTTVRDARITALPNPAPGPVMVSYDVPNAGPVEVSVIDPSGRRVATLVSGRTELGSYRLSWDRRDRQGRAVAPGVYFLRLDAAGQSRIVKLVLAGEGH